MSRQAYYLIAALLILASIPMYRYIFARLAEVDRSSAAQSGPAEWPQLPAAASGRRPLLAGEICRDGRVYIADGRGYHEAQGHAQAAVPCAGDHRVDVATVPASQRDRQQTWYAYGEKLPEGYKCSAADGPVYRTRIEHGVTTVEPLIRDGIVVHCGGGDGSSHHD